MAMNSKRPAARLAALNRELGGRGEAGTTKRGVPILRVDGVVVCFLGQSDIFRLFAADYERLADFDDTKEGVLELAAYLDQRGSDDPTN